MSDPINPNPRHFRVCDLVVDLDSVCMIYCGQRTSNRDPSNVMTAIVFKATKIEEIDLSDDEHEVLLQAFEKYLSWR